MPVLLAVLVLSSWNAVEASIQLNQLQDVREALTVDLVRRVAMARA